MSTPLVTVFGGTGFVGRHTVRALAKAGYRIRVAVRHPHKGFFLPPMGSVGQIALVKCNVREADEVAAAVRGASAVINLTGVLVSSGEQSFEAIHIEAAETIAKAARDAGAKTLVHVSAIGADKDAPSKYAASKGEGEARVREAFPAAILRPSLVFGAEDGFFNRFAALARFLPALPLIGGGHSKFQPVFVGDVAAAIVRCAADLALGGRTFELGGPTVYTFKDLMQLILRETGRKRLLVPVPFALASLKAFFLQFLPGPLKLTPDQVMLLKSDTVVTGPDTLASLGIVPTSVEAEIGAYLWRFRAKGQYEEIVRTIEAPAPR